MIREGHPLRLSETKQHNIKLWLASYSTDPLAMAWKDIWNCKQVPLDVHQKKKRYAIEQSFLLSSYWQIPLLETDAKCRFATRTSICDVSIITGTAKLPINLTLEQY